MVRNYQKSSQKRVDALEHPKHPLITRCWELPDGKLVVANTNEDTELDLQDLRACPSFMDYVKANKEPPKVGSLQPNTFLSAAEFSQKFLAAFAHAGEIDAAAAAAAAAEQPEAQPVEPLKPE